MKIGNQIIKLVICLILFLGFTQCTKKETGIVNLDSLSKEMTNREQATLFPSPNYKCKQFSSYDRATVSPDAPGWYANWDRSMFLRTEEKEGRKEYVMMDAMGPGAIVRFWMTFAGENAGKGIMRIYFDDEPTATIEGTAMEILSGGLLAPSPLSTSVSELSEYKTRGHNLYLPLPYSKRCIVTYESENILDAGAKTGGEAVYYNINYREYEPSIQVQTFSMEQLELWKETIQQTAKILVDKDFNLPTGLHKTNFAATNIEPGKNAEIKITGEKAIRRLSVNIAADNYEQALRSTLLEVWFDGKRTVISPLGDFFGTGYQLRPSKTFYTQVSENGELTAYWVMPFKRECQIKLHNYGTQTISIKEGYAQSKAYKWQENSMYFGSHWHQYSNLKTGEMKNNSGEKGAPFDINYINLNGKGTYMGDAITLFNTVYAWWGEGDEKIFVDGEAFPSHIGTGTEDYYGYAWCRPEVFNTHPFIAQPDGSGNFNPGYTVNMRLRSLDAIPFNRSLQFDMEMWHWTQATIDFAPVTFYYMLPDSDFPQHTDLAGATKKVSLERKDLITQNLTKKGIEAENLNLTEKTGGECWYQNQEGKTWSNNMRLCWEKMNSKDKIVLTFNSSEAKTVNLDLTGEWNNKNFTLIFNQNKLPSQKRKLKNIEIKKGLNVLEVQALNISKSEKVKFILDILKI